MNPQQRRVALVFKGTGSVSGWVRNFDFDPEPVWFAPAGSTIKAHDGFLKSYGFSQRAAWALVARALAQCPGCRLLITGHSLGGALATLAAAHGSVSNIRAQIDVYAYSSPRVFDREGASWFDGLVASARISSAFRFVNNRG